MKPLIQFVPMLVLCLVLDGPAFAQGRSADRYQPSDKDVAEGLDAALVVPPQCFSSGAGATFVKFCVTGDGNVSLFENPAGIVHINTREGYSVCTSNDQKTWVNQGFDVGSAEDGFGPATMSEPGVLPLTITRTTWNGQWQLKQTFSAKWPERGLDVKVSVKNLSGGTVPFVRLIRHADIDAGGTWLNGFSGTSHSTFGIGDSPDLNNPMRLALMMSVAPESASSTDFPSFTPFDSWTPLAPGTQQARACAQSWGQEMTGGDYVGIVRTRFASMKPGETRTMTLRYRRF